MKTEKACLILYSDTNMQYPEPAMSCMGRIIITDHFPHLPDNHLVALSRPRYSYEFLDEIGHPFLPAMHIWEYEIID